MFSNIKKQLGFGCMRLPMNGNEIDMVEFTKMVDYFMENGFNYFDTDHVYIQGKSELALKEALFKRYNREDIIFADKLSSSTFKDENGIYEIFNKQLEATGAKYFDFYLLHALSKRNISHYEDNNAFNVVKEFKEKGLIKHIAMSFHDTADVLDDILTSHPEVEVVQLQFNYADYYDLNVQSKACYDVCVKHNKKVIVMEPVKGGSLVDIPDAAREVFDELNNGSYASYAIRFCASFDNIFMVLSGMSNMDQMVDNISYMKDFKPLDDIELNAVKKVQEILNSIDLVKCTKCRYCVDGCPKNILIPQLISSLNKKRTFPNSKGDFDYKWYIKDHGKASDCIKCGKCEIICPQKLPIRNILDEIKEIFE